MVVGREHAPLEGSASSRSIRGKVRPVRVGVDTGGTFTDAVADDGRTVKVPSTPHDPSAAVAEAATALDPTPDVLAHGTTVATNALLERAGATVALVTTPGF